MKLVCKICGKILNTGRYYCSRKCCAISQKTGKFFYCEICGKTFYRYNARIKLGQNKFCSKKCVGIFSRKRITKKCPICYKKFVVKLEKIKSGNGKYCSKICAYKGRKTGKVFKCKICEKQFYSIKSKLKRNPKYCSPKCSIVAHSGERSYLWKGGITPYNQLFRRKTDYKKWRKKIIFRDGFMCKKCGKKFKIGDEINLHAHHIKSFSNYPELRLNINNGITLCIDCHEKEHGCKFPQNILRKR